MIYYCPVYEKDNNFFIIAHSDYIAKTKEDGYKIGVGTIPVECVLFNFKFTEKVLKVDTSEGLPHVAAKSGKTDILLIAGDLFDSTP